MLLLWWSFVVLLFSVCCLLFVICRLILMLVVCCSLFVACCRLFVVRWLSVVDCRLFVVVVVLGCCCCRKTNKEKEEIRRKKIERGRGGWCYAGRAICVCYPQILICKHPKPLVACASSAPRSDLKSNAGLAGDWRKVLCKGVPGLFYWKTPGFSQNLNKKLCKKWLKLRVFATCCLLHVRNVG